ncbi:MAG: TniQ family protein [Solobacterium sp.]|nr:TniQ family protein [Solobacterium sp.]
MARNAKKGALYVTGFSCAERSLFVAGKSPHKRKEIPMLPTQIKAEKDELAISYYLRLAYANGFNNLSDFYNTAITKSSLSAQPNALDMNMYHSALTLLIENDISEFTKSLTLFPYQYPFLKSHEIAAYTAEVTDYPIHFDKSASLYPVKINVCPHCWDETKVLRRFHYLPGVDVCPVHHVPLISCGYIKDIDMFDFSTGSPVEVVNGTDYSEWVYQYYKSPLQVGRDDILDWLKDESVKNLIPQHFGKISEKNVNVLMPLVFKTMMLVFSSYADAYDYFCSHYPWKLNLPADYQLIDGPRYLFKVKHSCGSEFYTNEETIQHGINCPSCDSELSFESRISKILNAGGESYRLAREPFSPSRIVIEHEKCGRQSVVNTSRILKPHPCVCELEDKQKKPISLKKLPPFQILRYPVPKHNFLTLKHTACGNTFTMTPLSQYSCPFCDSTYVGTVYRTIIEHFDDEFTLQDLTLHVSELPIHKIRHALTVLTDKGHLRTRGIFYAIQN